MRRLGLDGLLGDLLVAPDHDGQANRCVAVVAVAQVQAEARLGHQAQAGRQALAAQLGGQEHAPGALHVEHAPLAQPRATHLGVEQFDLLVRARIHVVLEAFQRLQFALARQEQQSAEGGGGRLAGRVGCGRIGRADHALAGLGDIAQAGRLHLLAHRALPRLQAGLVANRTGFVVVDHRPPGAGAELLDH